MIDWEKLTFTEQVDLAFTAKEMRYQDAVDARVDCYLSKVKCKECGSCLRIRHTKRNYPCPCKAEAQRKLRNIARTLYNERKTVETVF